MISRLLAVVLPLCFIAGCQSATSLTSGDLPTEFQNAGMPGAEQMRQRCLDQIPPGTSIEKAEKAMIDSGFQVQPMSDAQGAYLYCDLAQGTAKIFGTKNWQIKIRYSSGVVDDIVVSTGKNGRQPPGE